MATILGGLTTSHIPLIGKAIAQDLRNDPYWQPFFKGFPPAHEWLQRMKPDVAVVVYNDHGLNFFLDKMPTFAIGAAAEYRNADEGWGIPTLPPFRGEPDLSWHIIESVVADEFDPVTCQEMLVDHGFTLPMKLFWPGDARWPVRVVPVSVNTVQHPLPSPARCLKFGQAIGRAIASYPEDLRVVVIGTGGLSHQLDGPRAGAAQSLSWRLTEHLIKQGRIGCVPGVDFGANGEGYIRFCFARDRHELVGALESMRRLFSVAV